MNSVAQSALQEVPPIEAVLAEILTARAFQRWLEGPDAGLTARSGLCWLLTYLQDAAKSRWRIGVWPVCGDAVPVGTFFVGSNNFSMQHTVYPFPQWARELTDPRDWDPAHLPDIPTFDPHILALLVWANRVVAANKGDAA